MISSFLAPNFFLIYSLKRICCKHGFCANFWLLLLPLAASTKFLFWPMCFYCFSFVLATSTKKGIQFLSSQSENSTLCFTLQNMMENGIPFKLIELHQKLIWNFAHIPTLCAKIEKERNAWWHFWVSFEFLDSSSIHSYKQCESNILHRIQWIRKSKLWWKKCELGMFATNIRQMSTLSWESDEWIYFHFKRQLHHNHHIIFSKEVI